MGTCLPRCLPDFGFFGIIKAVSGLLKRSDNYRQTQRVSGAIEPGELVDTSPNAPVSGNDEILAEIDKVVAESKINVDHDTFRIKAQRRGLLLPVMVNLFGILVALAGVYGLYRYFEEEERALVAEPSAVQTAENALIEALQEQSQEELAAKEAEISTIQERLNRIEAEREALEANLESEIAVREQTLREELEAELAAERARLEDQGLSQGELEQQLQEFETQRQARFAEELAALEAEAEAERQALEENLAQLESEFQNQLASLEEERLSLQEELAVREAEIEARAEAELSAQEEELTEAQQRLATLAELQEREAQVSAQIVGFYNEIRNDLRGGRYEDALQGLSTLETYLNDPSLQEISLIQERQSTERFVISSLRDLIEERQSRSTDSGTVLAAARQLQRVTELVTQGNEAAAAGNSGAAEASYSEALEVIPEIANSYEYLLAQRQADLAAAAQAEAQGTNAALTRARQAAAEQRYQEALAEYQEAIEFLPLGDEAVGGVVTDIQRLSVLLDQQQTQARQTAASEAIFRQGEAALEAEQNGRAIDAFLTLLEAYPRSGYRSDAISGLEEAIASQRGSLLLAVAEVEAREASALESNARQLTALREQIAALEATLSDMEAEIASLREENEELRIAAQEDREESEAALAAAEAEIARLSEEENGQRADSSQGDGVGALPVPLPPDAQDGDPGPETVPTPDSELAGEGVDLAGESGDSGLPPEAAEAAARLERIRSAYREYRQREADTLQENEEAGRIAAKLYLDDFLQQEAVRTVLPGLGDTIRQYDRAFEFSGRRNALLDAADLVFNLSSLPNAEARREYLNRELGNAGEPEMEEFIQELLNLVEA